MEPQKRIFGGCLCFPPDFPLPASGISSFTEALGRLQRFDVGRAFFEGLPVKETNKRSWRISSCLFVCLFACLVGWLVGWLVVCLFVCLFVCLCVCLLLWLFGCLVGCLKKHAKHKNPQEHSISASKRVEFDQQKHVLG